MNRVIVLFPLIFVSVFGCAGAPPRVLSVRSEPADAEVCLKGKHQNKHVPPVKYCVGSTPLELSAVKINENGKARVIQFNDIDGEGFHLIVQRQGYAPQAVQVPGWEHFVTLRQEQPKEAAPVAQVSTRGMAKITSNPVGALVYVNDFLKGNTPYVLEADANQTVRLKIEQAGYRSIERSITVEAGKAMELNLDLARVPRDDLPRVPRDDLLRDAPAAARKPASVETPEEDSEEDDDEAGE